MKINALIPGLALVLVCAACGQQQSPGTTNVDTAADIATISASVDQFVAAWNVNDEAVLGSMLTEDVVLMGPDGPVQQGRGTILATMAAQYDITMAQQSATTDEVIVMGGHAYARGTWNIDPTPAAGSDALSANGKWTVLYVRGADGAWQMSRWMWNQPSPNPGG